MSAEPNLNETVDRLVKHSIERNHLGSFNKEKSGPPQNISGADDLRKHVNDMLNDPSTKGFVASEDGKKMYFYNDRTNTFLILDPNSPSGGSVYRPKTPTQGANTFISNFNKTGNDLGRMPTIVEGGLDAVRGALKAPGVLGKIADVADDAGKVLGKLCKVLGPLGAIAAGVEVVGLGSKAHAAVKYGALSPDAIAAYDTLLAAHVAQDAADPTIVGGEAAIQLAYEEWCKKYNVPEYLKKDLEPSSLMEMVTGQIKLGQQQQAPAVKSASLTGLDENSQILVQAGRNAKTMDVMPEAVQADKVLVAQGDDAASYTSINNNEVQYRVPSSSGVGSAPAMR